MDIKIFSSHRIDLDSEIIHNEIIIPIRCGAIFDERKNVNILGDNIGDNISQKKDSFCELTVLYWTWKNIKADFLGLCHYRRFLNFSKNKYSEDSYGNIVEEKLDEKSIEKYGLNHNQIETCIQDNDIIIAKRKNVKKFPERFKNIREHYSSNVDLHDKDIDLVLDIIAKKYPNYHTTAIDYFNNKYGYFCMMFVMKKNLFDDFCNWLFSILFEFEKINDMSEYSIEGLRTPGHLAERLLGVYVEYQKKKGIKVKELQSVIFLDTKRRENTVLPVYSVDHTINVVMSTNEKFVPMATTTIQSIIENVANGYNLDIVLLANGDYSSYSSILDLSYGVYKNVSIRFFDVGSLIKDYKLKASEHITIETFYRFVIPDIFKLYKKVLYMDCDLICNYDISKLFETNINDYWIAAVKDPDFIGQLCIDKNNLLYSKEKLKLNNPFNYFQAGVLLLNIENLKKELNSKELLRECADNKYRYLDQDVLNKYCEGHVLFLDMKWNTLIDCDNKRISGIIQHSPKNIYKEYIEARKSPCIVHYAGYQKPWNTYNCDMDNIFWKYARCTPFYEKLVLEWFCNITNCKAYDLNKQKQNRKHRFELWAKKHTPKWMRPFAKKIKKILRW